MDYLKLIESMTPDIYRGLKRAIEIGKWPNGTPLTPQQRQQTLEAVIAWGSLHLPPQERVGYIDMGHKAGDSCDDEPETTLKWKE